MKVYVVGEKVGKQPSFTMSVAPAATANNQEVPLEWVDDNNNPVQFQVEFKHGEAEVDDGIGRYLVDNGYARRTRLILPQNELAQLG